MEFLPDLPVETERLRLRPFTRADVDAVFDYRQRPDVALYLYDEPMSRETVTEIVQQRIGQVGFAGENDRVVLAAELREASLLIGEVSLILRSETSRQAEIGYIFHPAHHGRGYATEAARALLALGFASAGMHRIYARCAAGNTASRRVMERLGMRCEAHFREHVLVKGNWDEELVYALLEDEWRGRAGG